MNLKYALIMPIILTAIMPAQAQPFPVSRTEGKTCVDYAYDYATEQGGQWGVVVAYLLPWSQEATHYSAYEIVNNELHLRGKYYDHVRDDWIEYDYWIVGEWYELQDDGRYATHEYFYFWPDPEDTVRTCYKSQIQDNMLEVLGMTENTTERV